MPAAEAHGILSSVLCIDMRASLQLWLSLVFDDNRDELVFSEADLGCLSDLYDQTHQLLETVEFEFDLLLPEEDAALPERVGALSYWCKGFLYGLGAAKLRGEISDLYQEVLRDINAIAQIESDVDDDENEADFLQLTEYVRVAVQTIWFENEVGRNDNNNQDTLH